MIFLGNYIVYILNLCPLYFMLSSYHLEHETCFNWASLCIQWTHDIRCSYDFLFFYFYKYNYHLCLILSFVFADHHSHYENFTLLLTVYPIMHQICLSAYSSSSHHVYPGVFPCFNCRKGQTKRKIFSFLPAQHWSRQQQSWKYASKNVL